MNRADVDMVQGGCSPCFLEKAGFRFFVRTEMRGQKFERNDAVEPGVSSFIDHSHTTPAKLLHDLVARDGMAGAGREELWNRCRFDGRRWVEDFAD